jgi:2-phosphosulfolactate phosphatase
MLIDVALLPGQRFEAENSVCVVVDVLRASSSIVTLLERGASRVVAAHDTTEARVLHRSRWDHLLCGEEHGLPPEGFDYGNSPYEFSNLDLSGRSVILATSNGTRILSTLKGAPVLLVGCLLNRTVAAEAAVGYANKLDMNVTVICSAAYGGSTFVLEDALGAGAIVDAALRLDNPPEASDAARFARDAFMMAAADLPGAVSSAYHAAELVDAGLKDDVAYCSQLDVSSIAPVVWTPDGTMIIESSLRPFDWHEAELDPLSTALLDYQDKQLIVEWPGITVRGRLYDLVSPDDIYPYDQEPDKYPDFHTGERATWGEWMFEVDSVDELEASPAIFGVTPEPGGFVLIGLPDAPLRVTTPDGAIVWERGEGEWDWLRLTEPRFPKQPKE